MPISHNIMCHFPPLKSYFCSLHEEGSRQSQLFLKLDRPPLEDKPLIQVQGRRKSSKVELILSCIISRIHICWASYVNVKDVDRIYVR